VLAPNTLGQNTVAGAQGTTQRGGAQQFVSPQYVAAKRAQPRDHQLVAAVKNLDAYGDPRSQAEIAAWLSDAYAEMNCGFLVGLFAHCYLGPPYVDHQIDLTRNILQHFSPTEPVPAMFEAARPLARNRAYAFIEVYADGTTIPVRDDGEPVVSSSGPAW
jgi:hypothetical protein